MFRTLTSVFTRRRDPAQLALDFAAPPAPTDAVELLVRLRTLGLRRIDDCRLTRNRNVMVSFQGKSLRVHEGYLAAPIDVHEAIVRFIEGRTRAERRAARGKIVAFRVKTPPPTRRREQTHPDDEPLSLKLGEWHERFNAEHFGGTLKTVPVRVSRRMRSRLGHYSAATEREGAEIAISRRHLRRHGWTEALQTLLHEMVHQWQDETGLPIDHGPRFRAKAREVGIEASAKRAMTPRPS
ncbi:MAG TPA: SprT-like domain-containing protein [Gemmatimonadaceae bacterium]|jgi:SprT-like family protein|nr:SprT-like domain-containing protein [Gemmatimonadaceae bacterium]